MSVRACKHVNVCYTSQSIRAGKRVSVCYTVLSVRACNVYVFAVISSLSEFVDM